MVEMRHKKVKVPSQVYRERKLAYRKNRRVILKQKRKYRRTPAYKKWKRLFKRKSSRPAYLRKHYY